MIRSVDLLASAGCLVLMLGAGGVGAWPRPPATVPAASGPPVTRSSTLIGDLIYR